ncbi:MAG: hypothetical protein NWE76_07905 [Candidatus Bathyarchaeota archaeon]|nr:hypothetical protein [Candidatus Bathyarchaeota archaeon]
MPEQISEALGAPKYGSDSAHTHLRPPRSKDVIDKRGEKGESLRREAADLFGLRYERYPFK